MDVVGHTNSELSQRLPPRRAAARAATDLQLVPSAIDCAGPFLFRSELNESELAESIERHGLLQPLVVSATEPGRYVIVSGHRRFAAVVRLAWSTIPVRVLPPNQSTPQELFLIAVDENERANTYNNRDRLRALISYSRRFGGSLRLQQRFRVKRRQAENLSRVAKLAARVPAIFEEIENPQTRFSITHALRLDTWANRAPQPFPYEDWVSRCRDLSVQETMRELRSLDPEIRESTASPSLRFDARIRRLRRIVADVASLSESERAELRGELERALEALR